ncbi:DUF4307 domain-containing protein [Streptomyces sp. DSM 42041]|uniref:DUF4307 domain-containing protein n=1 Tax=Streptomyces hazeniae TaxID=3075538 RepID=A0ABU2NVC7_9ACTN|nr:DUF4307 domain-containing protein [Streptomyces sp. DSM 42041]MDT0380938.1 DUF4307 domain-containing protein [Streptomyces sp. DSM 42041]
MADTRARPPEGRYGRSGAVAGGRDSERGLRTVGAVLGVALLALVGWFGWSYVAGSEVSGSVITFRKVSDESVEARLEIHKDAGVTGVCTVRVLGIEGGVVGRKDVRVSGGAERVDPVVTVRTTGPAARMQLVGCHGAADG